MSNPDNIFKEKLFDLETPLGGSVSFEKVMAMRHKDRGPVWWKPALLVLTTLSVVSVTGYFMFREAVAGKGVSKGTVASGAANSGTTRAGNTQSQAVQPNEESANTTLYNGGKSYGIGLGTADQGLAQDREIEGTVYAETADGFGLVDASGLNRFGIHAVWNHFLLDNNATRLKLAHKFHLDPKEKHLPSVELLMATGSRSIRGFDPGNAYSVRGNHRFGQYSAITLWDLGKGWQVGGGLGYSQFTGNGEWRSVREFNSQKIDTTTVVIIQPGFPDKTVTTYDTSTVTNTETKTGSLEYRMSKVSVPLAFRYHIGQGRTLFRISGTVAPGMLTTSSGDIFSKESAMVMNRNTTNATFDARLGLGLYYLISTRTALIIEPGTSYQSVLGSGWKPYNRLGFGMGFGLVIKL